MPTPTTPPKSNLAISHVCRADISLGTARYHAQCLLMYCGRKDIMYDLPALAIGATMPGGFRTEEEVLKALVGFLYDAIVTESR